MEEEMMDEFETQEKREWEEFMKYPDLVDRKIQKVARRIAELSASEDREDEWWGKDTDIGDLPFEIQKHLARFYDWVIENSIGV